jgi:glycosyltransferase involved in cell wall biosynthesis
MNHKIKKIILIKTNLIYEDIRLAKEVQSLLNRGNSIILFCWDREQKISRIKKQKQVKNFQEVIFHLRAPNGPIILLLLPFWWLFIFFRLLGTDWDIVHAINLDSIIPASFAAKLMRRSVIYEMHDTYEDHILLPKPLRSFALYIDKIFMKLAKAVILVDNSRIQELNGIPNKNVTIIYNAPTDTKTTPMNLGKKYIIFYAGLLTKHRSIENVVAAIQDLRDVELIVAGYGDQIKQIEMFTQIFPNKIKFVGEIPYSEVLNYTASSDLLFSLYDPKIPLNRYASSNKLFEAMMCNKPILVSRGTSMDKIVEQEQCGLIVDCDNVDEIKLAIITLKENPELCYQLGYNGRQAFLKKFSWKIMEDRLFKLYESLT